MKKTLSIGILSALLFSCHPSIPLKIVGSDSTTFRLNRDGVAATFEMMTRFNHSFALTVTFTFRDSVLLEPYNLSMTVNNDSIAYQCASEDGIAPRHILASANSKDFWLVYTFQRQIPKGNQIQVSWNRFAMQGASSIDLPLVAFSVPDYDEEVSR